MSKELNILITGANGFIGSHILKYFSEKKEYNVTGLVRKTSNLFRLSPNRYNLIYASINDPMDKIIRGFDAVIHTAGKMNFWGTYEDYYKSTVEGTVNLLQASVRGGVKRFIYFSSAVVYGFDGNLNSSEEKELRPFHDNYCITKTIAEEKVMSFKDRMEIVIFRPATVFGPFDITITFPLIRGIENGLIAWPKGGKTLTSPCYVKNLVLAVERAIHTEEGAGEAYNISDGNDIPWRDFLSMIAEKVNSKPPRIPVPAMPVYYIITIIEKFYKIFKSQKQPLITSPLIAQVRKDFSFSIEKAKRLLKYDPPYTTKDGIKESAQWYYQFKNSGI